MSRKPCNVNLVRRRRVCPVIFENLSAIFSVGLLPRSGPRLT